MHREGVTHQNCSMFCENSDARSALYHLHYRLNIQKIVLIVKYNVTRLLELAVRVRRFLHPDNFDRPSRYSNHPPPPPMQAAGGPVHEPKCIYRESADDTKEDHEIARIYLVHATLPVWVFI